MMCFEGLPTNTDVDDLIANGFCTCTDSCEPHRHFSFGVECYHDGVNDHGHCPQAPFYGTGLPEQD